MATNSAYQPPPQPAGEIKDINTAVVKTRAPADPEVLMHFNPTVDRTQGGEAVLNSIGRPAVDAVAAGWTITARHPLALQDLEYRRTRCDVEITLQFTHPEMSAEDRAQLAHAITMQRLQAAPIPLGADHCDTTTVEALKVDLVAAWAAAWAAYADDPDLPEPTLAAVLESAGHYEVTGINHPFTWP